MVSGTDPCIVPCHVVAVFLFFFFPHFLIFFISPFSFILVFFSFPIFSFSYFLILNSQSLIFNSRKMLDKIIDIITAILPFFGGRKKRQQMMQDVKEFSELVKEQYGFLMKQLEKVLKDYFDLSDRVKEMHSEIFSLKGKLSEAVTLQCVNKECIQRNNGSESASSSTSLIPA